MKLTYPILVEKGSATAAWGAVVPDIAGCFSGADDEQHIIENVREAILLQLSTLDSIPKPSALADVNLDGFDFVSLVDVDLSEIEGAAKRINITIPSNILKTIDAAAKAKGVSRSSFLCDSALKEAAG